MLQDQLAYSATRLSDDELVNAINATERCVRCVTRSRRDLALMRLRCLRCEVERRKAQADRVS